MTDLKNNPERAAAKIHHLESFFNGLPHIMHMDKFPYLHELKIIGQELKQMTGLEACAGLGELWIAECQLRKITSLENCKKLKKLILYSNKIAAIEGLESLDLQVLWLNANCISKIEGIAHMQSLHDLNLAKNCITAIGDSLKSLANLRSLNLASNSIDSFQDITHLQHLGNLKHLCLKDPQYGYNPVTILCNYSLYVIYHMPGLVTLDTLTISQKVVKELADSTINKKKLWYFMRLNTIKRQMNEMVEKINLIRKAQSQALKEQINTLIAKMQDIRYDKAKKSKRNYDHINFKITKLKFELK